jgi:hypothetical protein
VCQFSGFPDLLSGKIAGYPENLSVRPAISSQQSRFFVTLCAAT